MLVVIMCVFSCTHHTRYNLISHVRINMYTVCGCLYSACEHVNHDSSVDTEEILGMQPSLDLFSVP